MQFCCAECSVLCLRTDSHVGGELDQNAWIRMDELHVALGHQMDKSQGQLVGLGASRHGDVFKYI